MKDNHFYFLPNRYVGLTYPHFLVYKPWRKTVYYLWKKFLCPRHIHLFDECLSGEHYLVCDACEIMVHIAHIETSEEACERIKKSLYLETSVVEKSDVDPNHHIIVGD